MQDESKPLVREDLQYRELDDGGVIYDTAGTERLQHAQLNFGVCLGLVRRRAQLAGDCVGSALKQTKTPMATALEHVHEAVSYFQNEGLLRPQ